MLRNSNETTPFVFLRDGSKAFEVAGQIGCGFLSKGSAKRRVGSSKEHITTEIRETKNIKWPFAFRLFTTCHTA